MSMFIYCIRNTLNNKRYIGQTSHSNPVKRWNSHKYELRTGTHDNSHLQRAWNKYGESCFEFSILETCSDISQLGLRERELIAEYNTLNRKYGYNIGQGGIHQTHSDETKEKLRHAQLGKKKSEAHKEKLRNRVYDDKTRQNMSDAAKGRKLSEETKQKISNALKGRVKSIETRRKLSEANKGKSKTVSRTDVLKRAESLKKRWADPKFKQMMLAARKPKLFTEMNDE